MIKKLRYIGIIIFIMYAFQIYKQASTYNANKAQVSLNAMLYLIPSNEGKKQFLHDFLSAAIDDRGTNLHGLSRDEIHELAFRKHLKNANK